MVLIRLPCSSSNNAQTRPPPPVAAFQLRPRRDKRNNNNNSKGLAAGSWHHRLLLHHPASCVRKPTHCANGATICGRSSPNSSKIGRVVWSMRLLLLLLEILHHHCRNNFDVGVSWRNDVRVPCQWQQRLRHLPYLAIPRPPAPHRDSSTTSTTILRRPAV